MGDLLSPNPTPPGSAGRNGAGAMGPCHACTLKALLALGEWEGVDPPAGVGSASRFIRTAPADCVGAPACCAGAVGSEGLAADPTIAPVAGVDHNVSAVPPSAEAVIASLAGPRGCRVEILQ